MTLRPPDPDLLARFAALLGPKGFTADAETMRPWLTDWRGRFTGRAAAMLSPANARETAEVVRLAAAARVAIVPQGGNTGMVAGATPDASGDALLLSTRRMRAIRMISAEDGATVAEAGVILAELHAAAEAEGLRFPLSLAAKGSATIGGLVSTNAGGTQVLRFGPMRALLLGIEAVLPDGALFEGLAPLRKDNRGYDFRQLLAGAEGTLGVVTAATLRLVPRPGARAVAWVGVASPEAALALLRRLEAETGDAVESFELVPQVALDLVLANVPGNRAPLGRRHAWNVLIEATAPLGARDPADLLQAFLAAAADEGILENAVVSASEAQADALWRLRESVPEAERIDGMAAKHDVAVPVSDMPRFIRAETRAVEARFPGSRVIAFGHLGDGNVHFNVRPPAGDTGGWLAAEGGAVNAFVHDGVSRAGGTISAEHGIGQTKLADFARLAGPTRLAGLRAVKAALDPHGIMNPGKLVPLASTGPRP